MKHPMLFGEHCLGWPALALAMSTAFACATPTDDEWDFDSGAEGNHGDANAASGGAENGQGTGGTSTGGTDAGGTSTGDTGGSNTGGSNSGSAVRSAGCGSTAALASPKDWAGPYTINVSGKDRTYYIHMTSQYTHAQPATLLIGFHGCGCHGGCEYWAGEIDNMQPGVGVYPEADGDCWDARADGADAALFDALHKKMIAEYCIDLRRVFVAGFSSGGMMSNTLACARADVITGAAPASGSGPSGNCTGPVPWIGVHGTKDGSVKYSAGIASRDRWVAINGCDAENPVAYDPQPTSNVSASCVKYQGCDAGFPVHWCEFNGGHETQPEWGGKAVANFLNALTQ